MATARTLYLLSLVFIAAYYPKFGRYPTYDWLQLAAVVAILAYSLSRFQLPRPNRAFLMPGLLLAGGAALTVPRAAGMSAALVSAIQLIYVIVVLCSLPSILFRGWTDVRRAYGALALSVVATVAFAIPQIIFGWHSLSGVHYWGRATGLTRQPNELGVVCATVVPYILFLGATARSRVTRVVGTLLATFAMLGTLLSGSMTGFLALVVGLLVFAALGTRRSRVTTLSASAVIIAAGLGLAVLAGGHDQFTIRRIVRFATSSGGKLTLHQRLAGYGDALTSVLRHPLVGRGYHATVSNLGEQGSVHNIFLRAWYDGGLLTLIAIVLVLLATLGSLIWSWRRARSDPLARLNVAAAAAAVAAFFTAAQASPVLYQRSSWFPVAIAFAVQRMITLVEREAITRGESATPTPSPCQTGTRGD